MKYSEAKQGRVFIIRLEHGEIIHEEIEKFAREKSINSAVMTVLGGADKGSILVVGPENGEAKEIIPVKHELKGIHELTGVGTLFPDEEGNPVLHMHVSCGREGSVITGCVREGVKTWHVLEIVLIELLDSTGVRSYDEYTGFNLLNP